MRWPTKLLDASFRHAYRLAYPIHNYSKRFYRADASRVRNGDEGSGLGLSIVDAVMRAHGGSVSVKSTPGAGATFLLNFPRGAH